MRQSLVKDFADTAKPISSAPANFRADLEVREWTVYPFILAFGLSAAADFYEHFGVYLYVIQGSGDTVEPSSSTPADFSADWGPPDLNDDDAFAGWALERQK